MNYRLIVLVWALSPFLLLSADNSSAESYLDPSLIQVSGDPAIGTGKFYGYRVASEGPGDAAFQKCLATAQASGKPLAVIWGNQGCRHCSSFTESLNASAELLSGWMKGKDALFSFFKDNSGDNAPIPGHQPAACYDAYAFTVECGVPVGLVPWPFYAFYQLKPDGTAAREAGSLAGLTAAGFMEKFDRFLEETSVEVPVPGDFAFMCGASSGSRLEAMPSTPGVWVPIARTNNCSVAVTNTLTATFQTGETVVSNVVWEASGASRQTQEVFVPTAAGWTGGGAAMLLLRDEKGILNASNSITFVAESAPSHHFPLWIGERTETTLGFGEWTFDLDTATNKVRLAAAEGVDAYTLVVVGGGLWCPDCISCERDITEDPKFTAWAQRRNIALVVSDQPQNGTTMSSMMTHDVGWLGNSGSYYLSRKGLTAAEGMEQFAAMTNRSYRLWKVEPSAVRVGNPTFILFRPTGTIAGRLVGDKNMYRPNVGQGSSSSDPFGFEENILRLEELIENSADTSEERNDRAWTTPLSYTFGETNTCRLCVCDMADVYRLVGFPADTPVRFAFSWPDGAKDEPLCRVFRVVDASSGATEELPRISEVEDVWKFTRQQIESGLYLEFSAFAGIASGKTLESRWTEYGGGTGMTVAFHAESVPPDPGLVGFCDGDFVVEESDGAFEVRVARVRGASGGVVVRVERDDDATSADPARYEWHPDDIAAHTLVWNESETGVQSVRVPIVDDTAWDGDQTISFSLAVFLSDGVGLSSTNLNVRLIENDTRDAGRVAIAGTDPAETAPMVVDAKPGETVMLTISRLGGSWGEAGTALSVSDDSATLSAYHLEWSNKNENVPGRSGEQTVALQLPESTGDCAVYCVALSPDEGTRADPACSTLYVRVRDAASLEYAQAGSSLSLKRSTSFSCEFTLESLPVSEVLSASVVFDSGFLPPGLEVVIDKGTGQVRISGIPCRTGYFKAAFHVEFITASGVVSSMPVVVGADVAEARESNPQLGVSHVFYDLPVVGASTGRLAGLLDVAIPVSGRVSARYRRIDGRRFSFAAKAWDDVQDADEGGVASVESARADCGFFLAFGKDGVPVARISDPSQNGDELVTVAPERGVWSAINPATDWQGQYTVEMPSDDNSLPDTPPPLCTGPAALSCRMTSAASCREGRMTVAGVLPNGRTFSAATHLLRESPEISVLPVMNGSSADRFGAILQVASGGLEQRDATRQMIRRHADYTSFWTHVEHGVPALSYSVDFDAFGSWYDPDDDWQARWRSDYFVDWEDPTYIVRTMRFLAGSAEGAATPLCAIGDVVRIADEANNPIGLSFEFNSCSGMMSGTMSTGNGPTPRTVRYRGVFLPGWAEGCDCGSSVSYDDVVVRPFASAPCWWDEPISYTDDDGRPRIRSVRRGCAVAIDK